MIHQTKIRTAFILAVCIAACAPKKSSETIASGNICFLNVTGQDSLIVRLTIQDKHVTGVLDWLPAEKDTMRGTLEGTLQDSIITARYTYTAEGITETETRTLKVRPDSVWIKVGDPDGNYWLSAPRADCL